MHAGALAGGAQHGRRVACEDEIPERHKVGSGFRECRHLVEIVRNPLLGEALPQHTVIAVLLITVFNLAVATIMFVRFRARIAYWV